MYFGEKAVLLAMVQRGIISRILPYIKRATVYKVVLVYHLHCKLILIFCLHEYLQPFFLFFSQKRTRLPPCPIAYLSFVSTCGRRDRVVVGSLRIK